MSSTTTSLINCNFGGIRRKNSVFSQDKITCSDCQNVELFFTKLNSGIGIRTSKGNHAVTSCFDSTQTIIGVFESIQDQRSFTYAYVEDTAANDITKQGKLYLVNKTNDTKTLLVDELSTTGMANGVSFTQGYYDMFIFSNGEEIKYIYVDTEAATPIPTVESDSNIYLYDNVPDTHTTSGYREVKGINLAVFDNRLWVSSGNTIWYSKQLECRDFHTIDSQTVTTAGYIEQVKPVTAIAPYLGSLAVFHKDSSVLISVDQEGLFSAEDESPGGCASYNSLVFHGTDLYFYDDTKKGVFSFQQIVNGDKTLSDNIAYDIQDELYEINNAYLYKIRTLSVITSDRNEVWFLVPITSTYTVKSGNTTETKDASIILIFDYIRGEWVKRKCQKISSIQIIDNILYSAGKQIYQEYSSSTFNGDFIESFYTCTILNLGEDNTLKITKFPPRLSVDSSYGNKFYVKYVKNYDVTKDPKIKYIKAKSTKNVLIYNSGMKWNEGYQYKTKGVSQTLKVPSATFKALEIKFYTQEQTEDFCIKAIEFSKIKVKQV